MNIIFAILIAIITVFAIKHKNHSQEFGLGSKRFAIATLCGILPFIDRFINVSSTNYEVHYQNTFMWSIILLPVYALALTGLIKSAYGDDVDAKYLYPAILVPTLAVVLLTFISTTEIAIFYPLLKTRYSLDLIAGFDSFLFVILVVGVVSIILFNNYRKYIARGFLAIVAIYVLALASFSLKARFEAHDYADALGLEVEKVYTIAQKSSVFNWKVLIFTADKKVHTSLITLKEEIHNSEYKAAENADWKIYRLVNPYYDAQYNAVIKYFGKKAIAENILKYSILIDSVNYKQYRCLRFKDLRIEREKKSLNGYSLFCQNPRTKNIKTLIGVDKEYKNIRI